MWLEKQCSSLVSVYGVGSSRNKSMKSACEERWEERADEMRRKGVEKRFIDSAEGIEDRLTKRTCVIECRLTSKLCPVMER